MSDRDRHQGKAEGAGDGADTLEARYRAYATSEAERWAALARAGVSSFADAFELAADAHPDRLALVEVETDRSLTYSELDRAADRVAAFARARRDATGESSMALRCRNGAEFLAAAIGLCKAGVMAVLVNTREPLERAAALARHAGTRFALGDEPGADGSILPGMQGSAIAPLLATEWPGRAVRARCTDASARDTALDETCWVIFTSGTSGRSKGARFSHRRMIGAGVAWGLRTGMGGDDRCYIALPLYHGNALAVAFSSCVDVGAAAVVRDRFSVRAFAEEIRRHRCTACVYIGEMWRYLDRDPGADGRDGARLRVVFGNGLTADLWDRTVTRYGIERVVEHFGATELPAGALLNWTGERGACGYIPPGHPDAADVALIDGDGAAVRDGTPGEVIIRVKSGVYRGYLDEAANAAKVRHSLFAPGDLWWCSGDTLTRDARGFYYFVERAGDSFRWKGENVAAVEVEDAIRSSGLVREVAVYGVAIPHHDGKAGVASLLPAEPGGLDLDALLAWMRPRLAPYALPRFIVLRPEPHPVTSTLKIQKAALAAAGLQQMEQFPHYVLEQGRYVSLTHDRIAALQDGRMSLRDGTR